MKDQSNAEIEELERLFAIAREHDLDAMLVEDGEWRVEIVRRDVVAVAPQMVAAAPLAAPAAETTAVAAPVLPPAPKGDVVTAPIVGVFYRAPAPGASAFVQMGDRVSLGQTLCILEAMKLMNEITSESSGIVTAIYPQNGDLVVIGQPLFEVTP